MTIGCLSVVLGVIGIFLPIMPTTPFLLLAAACFARSSQRFYHWLMNNRWFGPYLRYYTEGLGIPLKIKVRVIGLLWLTMGTSIIFFVPILWLKFAMAGVALGASAYIWLQPTAPAIVGDDSLDSVSVRNTSDLQSTKGDVQQ